jgi:hypothetical protein
MTQYDIKGNSSNKNSPKQWSKSIEVKPDRQYQEVINIVLRRLSEGVSEFDLVDAMQRIGLQKTAAQDFIRSLEFHPSDPLAQAERKEGTTDLVFGLLALVTLNPVKLIRGLIHVGEATSKVVPNITNTPPQSKISPKEDCDPNMILEGLHRLFLSNEGGMISTTGTISNTSNNNTLNNVQVEVKGQGYGAQTLYIPVAPNKLVPGIKGSFSAIQSFSCYSASIRATWD